jgi:hypothetical protein
MFQGEILTGISDLNNLLKSMKPRLITDDLVFCTISEETYNTLSFIPILMFKESEGITLILPKEMALEKSLCQVDEKTWAMICLTVHSSLEAIGFLAIITKHLAENGISVNVVSAYYHDHLFVLSHDTGKALNLLRDLSNNEKMS